MSWEKPSAELIARFDACLPADLRVERRKMFGCPCAFVNGKMFAVLHEQRVVLRLPEARRAALLAAGTASAFSAGGRTMREYVAVMDAVNRPEREWRGWLAESLSYAAAQ